MKNKKGFTLVELLAVIAILAILVIMALPAVLRMYRQSRINNFQNETRSVYRSAQSQFLNDSMLLESGQKILYTNGCSTSSNADLVKTLDMTGNSNFKYYVLIDVDGKILDVKTSNGTYSYLKHGSDLKIEELNVEEGNGVDLDSDISSTICTTSGSSGGSGSNTQGIVYVTRQAAGQITTGDEVRIDTEHFYVINPNDGNGHTVLLSKYNLYVGILTESYARMISKTDAGYGLQNEDMTGYHGVSTGTVAFSSKAYWDNANCINNAGTSCPGTSGLKSDYANSANAAGTTNYSEPYPKIYRSEMSTIAPSYDSYWNIQDNGYTIAYYVEEYVSKLKELGASNSITGRLLSHDEAENLSDTIKGNYTSYWIDSADSYTSAEQVYGGSIGSEEFWRSVDAGSCVRPVIVVPTTDIPS